MIVLSSHTNTKSVFGTDFDWWWRQTLVLLRVDWKWSKRDAESSPTENSSLKKYTNLDPCCYGNLLVEFHHQSNLHCVAARHAHTSHWLADCSLMSPMVGYLFPFSQPSIFLSSHIIESPMGTFFLLPHHLSLFSLLLGEKGDRKKRNEHRSSICTGEFRMDGLLISKPSFVFHSKNWKNKLYKRERECRAENRGCESFTQTHTNT